MKEHIPIPSTLNHNVNHNSIRKIVSVSPDTKKDVLTTISNGRKEKIIPVLKEKIVEKEAVKTQEKIVNKNINMVNLKKIVKMKEKESNNCKTEENTPLGKKNKLKFVNEKLKNVKNDVKFEKIVKKDSNNKVKSNIEDLSKLDSFHNLNIDSKELIEIIFLINEISNHTFTNQFSNEISKILKNIIDLNKSESLINSSEV